MGRGDESWHDDVGVTGDRAMPERIGSLPRQNSFDLRKFEGEEIGDLLGSEVVLREGEDRFDLILPDSLLDSLLNSLLNSQLDSFLDSFLDPDLFESFRGGFHSGFLRDRSHNVIELLVGYVFVDVARIIEGDKDDFFYYIMRGGSLPSEFYQKVEEAAGIFEDMLHGEERRPGQDILEGSDSGVVD